MYSVVWSYTRPKNESTIGLYDYNARFYDPEVGQFIQPDSLVAEPGNPIAWNRYAYVYNSPVNHTDPSGHIVDTVFDALALASDAGSCLGDSDALSCYMLPLDAVFLAVPGVTGGGFGDDALRAAGRVDEGKQIQIYGFRGTGRTAEEFIETDPLIYAGHVGVSFDNGKTIYGFTPSAPGLSSSEAIEVLKQHKSFPGQVLDDTALFHRAQDLAEQGYRTQVYVQSISVSKTDFNRIRKQVLREFNSSPLLNKRYAFPGPEGCFNCATWPSSHGIPIPEPSGNLRLYIEELEKVGTPWIR